MRRILTLISALVILFSCKDPIEPIQPEPPIGPVTPTDKPDTTIITEWPEGEYGPEYVWDDSTIPEITIKVSLKQWNTLLAEYDKTSSTTPYIKCDFIFDKNGARDTLYNAGIRVQDNLLGNRPEGTSGKVHTINSSEWNWSNYEVNFQYTNEERTLRKVNGIYLKSCLNDPSYARERFCHDLLRRFGVWTVGRNTYCRVNIHVDGDDKPAYIGIYQMLEPISKQYLSNRLKDFKGLNGYLWKCNAGGATLVNRPTSVGTESQSPYIYSYMLQTNQQAVKTATEQLNGFIDNVLKLKKEDFHDWIAEVCDIELLMNTYAVTVATGMWDDYSYRGTNFYLYFNNPSPEKYQMFFIPYNFDISLGTSNMQLLYDTGIQDPFRWGNKTNTFFMRLLSYDDFKNIYAETLNTLINESGLWDPDYCSNTIMDYMHQVSFYTDNVTGLNSNPEDRPARWSSNNSYRLTSDKNNFFSVRKNVISTALQEMR
ncbi:MAG: CotH kinase family protein [Bacteroidales bacterium]|nr:CotH kinase family protein [Bacteroidales bacterium]